MSFPRFRVGLRFAERVTGGFWYLADPPREHPFRFHLQAETTAVGRPLRLRATGTLEAHELAPNATLVGEIWAPKPWALRYELDVVQDKRTVFRLRGDKHHIAADVYAGMTSLFGTFVPPDSEVAFARFTARFDARGDVAWWFRNLQLSLRTA